MNRQVFDDEDRLAEQFLGSQAEAEWQRLRRQVELSPGFWLGFLFSHSPRASRVLAARLDAVYRSHARRLQTLRAESPDEVLRILTRLFSADARSADAVWVVADRDLATQRRQAWATAWHEFFLRLNERRDRLRREFSGGLILEVPPEIKSEVRNAAPDLWSIRSLVLEPAEPAVQRAAPELPGRQAAPDRRLQPADESPDVIPAGQRTRLAKAAGPLEREVTALLRAVEGLLAADQAGRAVEQATQAVDLLAAGDQGHPLLIDALAALARAEAADGDDAAALGHFRRLLQLAGDSDHGSLLAWLDAAATAARNVGQSAIADAFVFRQEAVSRRRLQQYGESPQALRDVSVSLNNVGNVRRESGDLSGAEGAYTESLEIRRRLLQQYGESPQALRDVSVSLNNVGNVRRESGDLSGAEGAYTESLEIRRRLLQQYGESPQALRDVSVSLNNVGNVRRESGDLSGAEGAYTESLEIRRRLLQQYGESPGRLRDLHWSLRQMRDLRDALGDEAALSELDAEIAAVGERLRAWSARHDVAESNG